MRKSRRSLNEILTEVTDGQSVGFYMATNQDGGAEKNIVAYAEGHLTYRAANLVRGIEAQLATSTPIPVYFNDRQKSIPLHPEGSFGPDALQLFRWDATEQLGVKISVDQSLPHAAHLTFVTWAGGEFDLPLEEQSNVLIGEGPSLGQSSAAIYLFSFDGPYDAPVPPH